MEYIVLDLEWNQSNTGKEDAVEKLPFEIIEIGAIKLNNERVMVSEFNELVKPQVYHEMHKITSKLIHIQMQELERGRPFPEVGGDFVRWCGQEEYKSYLLLSKNKPSNKFLAASAVGSSPGLNFLYISIIASS